MSEPTERITPAEPVVADTEVVERPAGPRGGRGARAAGIVAVIAVTALVAGVLASNAGGGHARRRADRRTSKVATGPAAQAVMAAATATAASGGYDFRSEMTMTASTKVPRPTCRTERSVVSHGSPPDAGVSVKSSSAVSRSASVSSSGGVKVCSQVQGAVVDVSLTSHGTINVSPYSLVSMSDLSNLGPVVVRTDGTNIWEHGGAGYGLAPDGTEGAGQPLSGFASLVGGTLGTGRGATTMITLANPTGYMSLAADAITSATPAGSGVVDGVAVTYYDITLDITKMGDFPGLNDEQRKTIREALAVLDGVGYAGTTQRVGIDADGYVKETSTVATYKDGGVMKTHTVLSRFGCVGRVLMPGQAGTSTAPSPDCTAPVVTTTTSVAPPVGSPAISAPPNQGSTTTTLGGEASTTSSSTSTTVP